MSVANNLAKLKLDIQESCQKVNRNPHEITVIAVTKYVSVLRTAEAIDAGVIHIGENREEGILEKWNTLKGNPIWHFIGSLQTRKVKNIIHIVNYIHSLDRLSLAEEINKRATSPVNCLIQVNVSGEETKHGMKIDEVIPFIEKMREYPKIHVSGLMTMAPFTNDEKIIRKCFRDLKTLQLEILNKEWSHASCKELSMGMSNDFKIAIEEGATMIRIGTALVGEV